MATSFHCYGTFALRQMRVVSPWSSSKMMQSCLVVIRVSAIPREGRSVSLLSHLPLPSSLRQSPISWARSRGYTRLVAGAASSGFRGLACRVQRFAASEIIVPISCRYAICFAAVSVPRHGHTLIRHTPFSPAAPIWCFGKIHAGVPCVTASPTQRHGTRRNIRLLHVALS